VTSRGGAIVAVHGGAGAAALERGAAHADAVHATLRESLAVAAAVLGDGGAALDAVVAAVRVLEDGEELNAGRGAALTELGTVELSAGVADGATQRFGGVALVNRVRNPVELARAVLRDGRHVLLVGADADQWAMGVADVEIVAPDYFVTEHQRRALEHRLATAPSPHGTVGAVARDRDGHLAAATSTGGITGQRPGRVGDSPIAGAGTWADDATCAVSATGSGEVFLRVAFAHDVHSRMRLRGDDLATACTAALDAVVTRGGQGGCIAVDEAGRLAMPFTTAAMPRGWWRDGGDSRVALGHDEAAPP
jgi:isoaspartyl peptidase/L-asparaginase-like protein (Ntn-hydrolase superfamily)